MSTHISEAAKQAVQRIEDYKPLMGDREQRLVSKRLNAQDSVQRAIDTETKQWRECAEKLAEVLRWHHQHHAEGASIYFHYDNSIQKLGEALIALSQFDNLNRTNP